MTLFDLKPYSWIASGISALFAFVAAACWVVSTIVEDKPKTVNGIGPGWDGYFVALNADGKPINFVKTFQLQSKWSRRAAWAASIAAVAQGIATMLDGQHPNSLPPS